MITVSFVGRLGADPVSRAVGQSTVCSMNMAVDTFQGQEKVTVWLRVNMWGVRGEACQRFLAKGRQAFVTGTLSQSEYTGRDGEKRTTLEVRADRVEFVGGAKEADQPAPAADGWNQAAQGVARRNGLAQGGHGWAGQPGGDPDGDDPIPF